MNMVLFDMSVLLCSQNSIQFCVVYHMCVPVGSSAMAESNVQNNIFSMLQATHGRYYSAANFREYVLWANYPRGVLEVYSNDENDDLNIFVGCVYPSCLKPWHLIGEIVTIVLPITGELCCQPQRIVWSDAAVWLKRGDGGVHFFNAANPPVRQVNTTIHPLQPLLRRPPKRPQSEKIESAGKEEVIETQCSSVTEIN